MRLVVTDVAPLKNLRFPDVVNIPIELDISFHLDSSPRPTANVVMEHVVPNAHSALLGNVPAHIRATIFFGTGTN